MTTTHYRKPFERMSLCNAIAQGDRLAETAEETTCARCKEALEARRDFSLIDAQADRFGTRRKSRPR